MPTSRTAYLAKAKGAGQPRPDRPGATRGQALAKVGRHRFRTRISAAQSFGGKIALFQKRALDRVEDRQERRPHRARLGEWNRRLRQDLPFGHPRRENHARPLHPAPGR